ncbi:hypothetical protein LTR78_010254 [Recurvomyces mirabilis]|uniref:Macro domain-containing protein n=1 Tax=Recurvomyces mirabilis TaxID=574656 RepID=A0AAE0TQT3_9PEZI|nr:hypothetical protein LTR78_010254 [Recurvomyces mirabilis]KAK5156400.1 hypothetical protein LTS14_005288 [Recurvomyces mirabilis]
MSSTLARHASAIQPSSIPTLNDLYTQGILEPADQTHPQATSKYNTQICLIRTDITTLATDCIVNAANESLLGGGGVDGAIHSAAGPGLLRECRMLDGCDTGSAKITGAYQLPCKRVIHAVGPIFSLALRQGKGEPARLLGGCYTTSLDLAVENGCKSIAFSALSTGVYGYKSQLAARDALTAVKGWLDEDEERARKIERIVFCSFLAKDEAAYEEWVPRFFPPAAENKETSAQPNDRATTMDGTEKPAEETKVDETSGDMPAGELPLPVLPDVPTKESTEPGQPDAKKQKIANDDNTTASIQDGDAVRKL